MCVYRRGLCWYYDFVRDGKRYTKSTKIRIDSVNSRERALEVEYEIRRELWGDIFPQKGAEQTLREFIEERVMPNVRLEHRDRPNTIDFYQNCYGQILKDEIAEMEIGKIGRVAIGEFTKRITNEGYAVSTVNRRLACVRKALRRAVEEEVIPKAPIVQLLSGENRRHYVFDEKTKRAFLEGLREPYKSAITFLFETGLRVSELCTLKKVSVFLNEKRPYFRVHRDFSKNKEDRYIPLTPVALEIAKKKIDMSRCDFVFTCHPSPLYITPVACAIPLNRNNVGLAFRNRARVMGLPPDAVLHSTRHTMMTELGASGTDLFTLMKIAGWKTPEMAARYVHPMNDRVVFYINKVVQMREKNRAARVGNDI